MHIEVVKNTLPTFQYKIKPEIAIVTSNHASIPYFSYSDHLDQVDDEQKSKIHISFKVSDDIHRPSYLDQKFHFCYGSDGLDEIYFERHLGLGFFAKLYCKDLMSRPKITINKWYHRFIRFKMDNVHPPGAHLTDILTIQLLEKNFLPLHCAAVSLRGDGFIIAAPPDTGKTVTSMLATKNGFGFLSEDIAIADDTFIYSNPQTATFYHIPGFKENRSIRQRLFNFANTKMPALCFLISPPSARIYEVMKTIDVDAKAPVKGIFILEKGSELVEEIDTDEVLRRMLIINRNEFSYYKNTLIFAHSYFNRLPDLGKLQRREEELMLTLASKARCYLVRSSNSMKFIDSIKKVVA